MADDEIERDMKAFERARQEDPLAADLTMSSAQGPLADRIEGAIQTVVDHPSRRLTNLFNRQEPRLYSRMNYSQRLKQAVRETDADLLDEDGKPIGVKKGFSFPDMDEGLISQDIDLRTSVKQQTRKIIESMTHIFERGGEQGRRGFFRRGG